MYERSLSLTAMFCSAVPEVSNAMEGARAPARARERVDAARRRDEAKTTHGGRNMSHHTLHFAPGSAALCPSQHCTLHFALGLHATRG
eukprot:1551170-Rhodomonas_salina.1